MKKLLMFLCILLFAPIVHSSMLIDSFWFASSDCPSGTYTANWDADHASGFGYICYDSGAGSVDASADTLDNATVGYLQYDAVDEYLEWTDANVVLNDQVGTRFMTVTITHGGDVGTNAIWESYSDFDNKITCRIEGATDDYYCRFEGDNVYNAIMGTSAVTTSGQAYRLGYTWCDGGSGCNGGTDAHAITSEEKGTATSWVEVEEAITPWNASHQPNSSTLGEHQSAYAVDDNVKIEDACLLPTYRATDPNP